MRAIVTGQVGVNKKGYLKQLVDLAGQRGTTIDVYNVGDRMYAEAPDIRPGRILDLPLARLRSLRRAAFKDIISESEGQEHAVLNTHATFRWRHGLFAAFDFDQIQAFKPDMLICLMDNIEVVHARLHENYTSDATLKDLMVWREEEIMVTEMLAQALGIPTQFYVLSRGREVDTIETCYRLICKPEMRKVYPSFPMTHVEKLPEVRKRIDAFRAELADKFVAFDPADVDEKLLLDAALEAAKNGEDFIEADAGTYRPGEKLRVSVREVLDIAKDVDGQIYTRDFQMVRQSDMIVSLVPELPGGAPGLSSGVERELQHAFDHSRDVYVVYHPKKPPSPFITETATKVFRTTEEAMAHFEASGFLTAGNLFGH
ncbi:MAG: ATP-binding protein [Phycisphaerales bacterium JB063]